MEFIIPIILIVIVLVVWRARRAYMLVDIYYMYREGITKGFYNYIKETILECKDITEQEKQEDLAKLEIANSIPNHYPLIFRIAQFVVAFFTDHVISYDLLK